MASYISSWMGLWKIGIWILKGFELFLTVQLMLNSFCKQNNHSGVEFAKILTVCKAEIPWQTHHHFGSGSCQGYPRCMLINMFWTKVLVVQGLWWHIWTAMFNDPYFSWKHFKMTVAHLEQPCLMSHSGVISYPLCTSYWMHASLILTPSNTTLFWSVFPYLISKNSEIMIPTVKCIQLEQLKKKTWKNLVSTRIKFAFSTAQVENI